MLYRPLQCTQFDKAKHMRSTSTSHTFLHSRRVRWVSSSHTVRRERTCVINDTIICASLLITHDFVFSTVYDIVPIVNVGQRRTRAIGLHPTHLVWMTHLGSMDHTFGTFCESQTFMKNAACGIDSTFAYGFIMTTMCTLISYHRQSWWN